MKDILAMLLAGQTLTIEQSSAAFELIMTGQAGEAQIASFLSMIQMRGATVEELVGGVTIMRRHVVAVPVPSGLTVVDTCGTGGDHGGTFNVSTAAALVTAGAGRKAGIAVAKHGNRSVTSKSGSSQVLEALGVRLDVGVDVQKRCLEEAGICFCLAPLHHPAMKHVMPTRLQLGFRTMFNILGPLTNPAGARRQLVGAFNREVAGLLVEVLARLEAESAWVVTALTPEGALDELSINGTTTVYAWSDRRHEVFDIDPSTLGIAPADQAALKVDSPEASAEVIGRVLAGEPGPCRDMVLLNAAAALVVAGMASTLQDAMPIAAESIDSGAASQVLTAMKATTTQS